MNNRHYNEYVAKVIDEEGNELSIKTYALTMHEALDNIVLMPAISHPVSYTHLTLPTKA